MSRRALDRVEAALFDANMSEPDSKIADAIAQLRQTAIETSQEARQEFNEKFNKLRGALSLTVKENNDCYKV